MQFDLTQVASLGLGAVVAMIVLNWKRDDDRKYAESLQTLVAGGEKRFDLMLDAFRANTEALNGLRETLDRQQSTEKILDLVEQRLTGCMGSVTSGSVD